MADWSILGWQLPFTGDTVRSELQADRRRARCRTPVSNTVRYGTSRLHPATFLSEEATREYGSIALEDPMVKLGLLSGMDSCFVSSTVARQSASDHPALLDTSSLPQSQARDLYAAFGPPRCWRVHRATSQREVLLHPRRSSPYLRPASDSFTDRVLYQRRRQAPLGIQPRCLHVARYPLLLDRETSPLVSVKGREDAVCRPPVLLPRTSFLLLPVQRRYAVRVATFREQSIQSPTRHPSSFHRLLPINAPIVGTNFASNRSDWLTCLAGKTLLFSFKPDA